MAGAKLAAWLASKCQWWRVRFLPQFTGRRPYSIAPETRADERLVKRAGGRLGPAKRDMSVIRSSFHLRRTSGRVRLSGELARTCERRQRGDITTLWAGFRATLEDKLINVWRPYKVNTVHHLEDFNR